MAQIQKLEAEAIELKCSADKFYDVYRNNVSLLIKYCPEIYKSIDVLEGDGKSVGTVRLWKLDHGGSVFSTRETLKAVDDKNRSITFSANEGDLTNPYEILDFKLSVVPKGSGTGAGHNGQCLVKWSLEYMKKNEDSAPPNALVELMCVIAKKLEGYLVKP